MAASDVTAERPHLGERKLSVIHAIGQSLSIGPIFSAGVISGLVTVGAGYGAPLSVVLGSIGALCLGYVIAVYARQYAGAGFIYEYLARGVNPTVGIFSAGLYFVGSLFLGAGGIYIAISFISQSFFQNHLHWNPAWWIGGAAAIILVFLMNHFGVRIAIRGVLTLAAISSIPMIFLALVIIAKGGASGNTLLAFTPHYTTWNGIFNGILFAVTLYIGFEAAASIAEETRDPRRAIPIAVITTIAICAVFYTLVTYAADIGYGVTAVNKGVWAASSSPMSDLATKYVGSWLSFIIDLVIIFDMLSLSIAIMVTVSRGFFALGRDGLLPRATAITSRYHTPLGGNLIVAIWSALLLIVAGVASYGKSNPLPGNIQTFFITASIGSYLVELIYVFLAVFAFWVLWNQGRRGARDLWAYIVVFLGGLTPILAFKGQFFPFPTYPNNIAFWVALICIAVVAVWTAIVHAVAPDRVRNAALYAIEQAEEPPFATGPGLVSTEVKPT